MSRALYDVSAAVLHVAARRRSGGHRDRGPSENRHGLPAVASYPPAALRSFLASFSLLPSRRSFGAAFPTAWSTSRSPSRVLPEAILSIVGGNDAHCNARLCNLIQLNWRAFVCSTSRTTPRSASRLAYPPEAASSRKERRRLARTGHHFPGGRAALDPAALLHTAPRSGTRTYTSCVGATKFAPAPASIRVRSPTYTDWLASHTIIEDFPLFLALVAGHLLIAGQRTRIPRSLTLSSSPDAHLAVMPASHDFACARY
ncbi:hypothetical protein AURDEDRAFT_172517 [Auricularia subglabra TFB-10046 SS5]|nr:hypothetical protein AURDEDRAFT_172517 [Auricularia subglabra TFB-10046 SS5]